MRKIKQAILNSIETKLKLANDARLLNAMDSAGRLLTGVLERGNKILIAGNGGSAADAQHFAAELAGKFVHKRKGLAAVSLTTNSSIVTAIANDFGYEEVFSRQLEALGTSGDVFISISTSGNSNNLVHATEVSKDMNIYSIGLLGNNGGRIGSLCDLAIIVPSLNTQAIQESHILIIHIICQIIDDHFAS